MGRKQKQNKKRNKKRERRLIMANTDETERKKRDYLVNPFLLIPATLPPSIMSPARSPPPPPSSTTITTASPSPRSTPAPRLQDTMPSRLSEPPHSIPDKLQKLRSPSPELVKSPRPDDIDSPPLPRSPSHPPEKLPTTPTKAPLRTPEPSPAPELRPEPEFTSKTDPEDDDEVSFISTFCSSPPFNSHLRYDPHTIHPVRRARGDNRHGDFPPDPRPRRGRHARLFSRDGLGLFLPSEHHFRRDGRSIVRLYNPVHLLCLSH